MKKQSVILQAMYAAIDELELLLIEGEILDVDIIVDLQKRFKKLEKLLNKKSMKNNRLNKLPEASSVQVLVILKAVILCQL